MELKKTLTSIFFVPTLGINREGLYNNGYLNGYFKDINKEVQYENCIYLLFKPKNIQKFKDFLDNEYARTKQIIDDYDYENGFIVVVYKLDLNYKNDFKLIKLGKYSETSAEFQKLFPVTLKVKKIDKVTGAEKYIDDTSLQYRIFNKTIDLKEYWENKLAVDFDNKMEVWDTWEEIKEILDINNIKQIL